MGQYSWYCFSFMSNWMKTYLVSRQCRVTRNRFVHDDFLPLVSGLIGHGATVDSSRPWFWTWSESHWAWIISSDMFPGSQHVSATQHSYRPDGIFTPGPLCLVHYLYYVIFKVAKPLHIIACYGPACTLLCSPWDTFTKLYTGPI